MFNQELQIILIGVAVANLLMVTFYIRKMQMRIKYALLWIILSLSILAIAVFPIIFKLISEILYISDETNTVYMFGFAFLYLLSFSFSIIVSRYSKKINSLTQHLGLVSKRVTELEEQLQKYQDKNN